MVYIINQINTKFQDIEQIKEILFRLEYNYWLENVLFSWQWWFLLISTIVPWLIWWKKVNKSNFFEIITFGFWWVIVAVTLDDIGVTLHLWDYPKQLTFLMPPLVPADFTIFPVTFMFLYQYTNNWKSFSLGTIIVSLVFSFIVEPLFLHFQMMTFSNTIINWTHMFSFISFIFLSLCIRKFHLYIVDNIQNKQ